MPLSGRRMPSFVSSRRKARGPRRGRCCPGRGADDRHAGVRQQGELERCLSAELHDDANGLLAIDDVQNILHRQRLEVEFVERVVIGVHGFRIQLTMMVSNRPP